MRAWLEKNGAELGIAMLIAPFAFIAVALLLFILFDVFGPWAVAVIGWFTAAFAVFMMGAD